MVLGVNQESRTVVGGNYDFDKNLLVLDVKVSKTIEGRETPVVYSEKRFFEISSLKITRGGSTPNSVELLGARTQEEMNRILPSLVEVLKQLKDTNQLLQKQSAGEWAKKTLSIRLINEAESTDHARVGSTVRGQLQTNSENLTQTANGTYTLLPSDGGDITPVDDTTHIQNLFKLENWESLLDKSQESAVSRHEWKSFAPLKNSQENLNHVLNAIQRGSLLERACIEHHNNLISKKAAILDYIAVVNQQVAELHNFSVLNEEKISESKKASLQDIRENLLESKSHAERMINHIEEGLPALYRELAIMLSVKNLHEQVLINKGESSVGALLTEEWDELVTKYRLMPTSIEAIDSHLENVLGLNLVRQIEENFTQEYVKQITEETIQSTTESIKEREAAKQVAAVVVEMEERAEAATTPSMSVRLADVAHSNSIDDDNIELVRAILATGDEGAIEFARNDPNLAPIVEFIESPDPEVEEETEELHDSEQEEEDAIGAVR